MLNHTCRIDPIRALSALDSELASLLEDMPGWSATDWQNMPPAIIGWRLTFLRCGQAIEQQDFQGGDDGFKQAQDAGKEWLASNGSDGISQWMASSREAMRRMNYDPDFRHQMSKRGF